ncbi:glycosyltransferase [Seohaeicola saemankumensis]|uniref:Glycosyltransferase n=1 Tax=Seohaeicola saemankumensis TaxID=481181 RepID=A0ABW3TET4_9RHOB
MYLQNLSLDLLIVFATSVAVCALIIFTRDYYMPLIERRADSGAVQAAHKRPTPRIGGITLVVCLLPIAAFVPPDINSRFWLFTLSVLPVVIAGLAEDLGYHIRPVWRLLAAALSSIVAIILLGVWLPRTDMPGLDYLMVWAPFAWFFTIFACAGICNAFNLIDGLNGLASGVGVITALGLAAIASQTGHGSLVEMKLMLVAALLGFMIFNFPLGKIFLGDVGAYALGHLLAWFSIALLIRVPDLTTWAVLLIFFWPIADTFFAIYRRRRAGRPTDMPDRLHYHQLVMRALEITLVGRDKRHIANPLATLVILPMASLPVVAGVMLWDEPLKAFFALCAFSALFALSYILGIKNVPARRRPYMLKLQSLVGSADNVPMRKSQVDQ